MKEDDQDQYLMWMRKRREILMMNSINGSSSSSWDQEKAFSEDLHGAAGSLGGCVWPPRSYTCSFCMREFKSAQALGGHMNIHRRDRARLKQYCLTRPLQNDNISDDHHINHDNHDHHQYSLKLHPINSSPSTSATASIRFLSPNYGSRVSAEQPFFSSTFSDHDHDLSAKRVMLDLESPNSEKNRSKLEDSSVETDLCVGLNNRPSPTGFCGDHDEYETSNYKRPKLLSFFFKPCRLQSNEVIDLEVTEAAVNNSMDDLDLELRLGEPPKVK